MKKELIVKIALVIIYLIPIDVIGQETNSYLRWDDEFDESSFRRIASSFGYNLETIDSLVAFQHAQFLKIQAQSNSSQSQNFGTNVSVNPCGSCSQTPISFPPTLPPYYNPTHSYNINDEADYFETPEPFQYWLGMIGGFNASGWDYSGQFKIDASRHFVVTGDGIDPLGKFPVVAPGSAYSVRLGGPVSGAQSEKLIRRYDISSSDPGQLITYRYAAVLENPDNPSHLKTEKPSLSIKVFAKNSVGNLVELCCARYEVFAGEDIPGFVNIGQNLKYKNWTTSVLDLGKLYQELNNNPACYGTFPSQIEFYIEFAVFDCTLGGHFGYAYIDGGSMSPKIVKKGRACLGLNMKYSSEIIGRYSLERIKWDFGDGTIIQCDVDHKLKTITNPVPFGLTYEQVINPQHAYQSIDPIKTYKVEVSTTDLRPNAISSCNTIITSYRDLEIYDCKPIIASCEDCIQSFAPITGEPYLLSAWASQVTNINNHVPDELSKYTKPNVQVKLIGPDTVLGPFYPSGLIIDGWQKIETTFDLPSNTTAIEVILNNGIYMNMSDSGIINNEATSKVYFDDIRIGPVKSSLKSFVYDPRTQRLMAEMDENNYATLYEYDEEGKLIRVKKETSKGVSTLRETNINLHKKGN